MPLQRRSSCDNHGLGAHAPPIFECKAGRALPQPHQVFRNRQASACVYLFCLVISRQLPLCSVVQSLCPGLPLRLSARLHPAFCLSTPPTLDLSPYPPPIIHCDQHPTPSGPVHTVPSSAIAGHADFFAGLSEPGCAGQKLFQGWCYQAPSNVFQPSERWPIMPPIRSVIERWAI